MWNRRRTDSDALVEQALRELADHTPSASAPGPDPSFIWWKAQLLRRLDAERETTAFIDMGERFHIGAAVVGACALAVGAWDYLPTLSLSPFLTLTTAVAAVGALVLLALVAVSTQDSQGRH